MVQASGNHSIYPNRSLLSHLYTKFCSQGTKYRALYMSLFRNAYICLRNIDN